MTFGTILLLWLVVSLIAAPLCGLAMRLNGRRQTFSPDEEIAHGARRATQDSVARQAS
jgi:hypothetical protein